MQHLMSKVLIVDDSPTQLHSLRKIVEQGGYEELIDKQGWFYNLVKNQMN